MFGLSFSSQTQALTGIGSVQVARDPVPLLAMEPETTRPSPAPARAEHEPVFGRDSRLAEPVRAASVSVFVAKEPVVAAGGAIEEPDPMVPPVPMRYLSRLMQPEEPHGGGLASPMHDAVVWAETSERDAEAGTSLDVLR